jgi:hypothetical protein
MKKFLVITLLLLASSTLYAYIYGENLSRKQVDDCTYLLAVLEKTLNLLNTNPGEAIDIVNKMMKTNIAPALADPHRKAYETLIKLYRILFLGNYSDTRDVYELYIDIDSIADYVNRLRSCSRDRDAVTAIATRIRLTLDELRSEVEMLMYRVAMLRGYIYLRIEDKVYEPEEAIPIEIDILNNSCIPRTASLILSGTTFSYNVFTCIDSSCYTSLKTPSTTQVKNYVNPGINRIAVVIKVQCLGREVRVYRFINVMYRYPEVVLEIPSVVKRGNYIDIAIHSKDYVEGILYVKNSTAEVPIKKIVLNTTSIHIALRVDKPIFSTGINIVKLCFNATQKTLPKCFEKTVFVEPRYPRIEVETSSTQLTLFGKATLFLVNRDNATLIASIHVGGRNTYTVYLGPGEEKVISTSINIMPIYLEDVKIVVRDIQNYYDTYIYTASITVANISILLSLPILGLIVVTVVNEYEKVFIATIATNMLRSFRKAVEITTTIRTSVKPYILGLGSRIAELYYSVVKKFSRLPHDSETLREHYRYALTPVIKSTYVKELLWRFLVLVEKDLYSRYRQDIEEAKKIAKDILSEEH